ncbi:MAG TPA: metal-dependent hydrolase [Candidatus Bathyarchaeia archaeon]|nr:metal-dependent hydrolase [Candidatus Bathyarchaeia archaeon]
MTARTHDVFAFASLVTVGTFFPPVSLNLTTIIVSSIGSVIGSLLPDIDQASNRLWDLLPGGDFIGRFLKNIFLSHRTISHSIIGTFLTYKFLGLTLPLFLNPNFIDIQVVYLSIMVGFISHLLLDSFTEGGLPLFFPLKLKIGFPPIASWRIKTGKWFEKYVVFPGIIVYILFFVGKYQEAIVSILRLAVK